MKTYNNMNFIYSKPFSLMFLLIFYITIIVLSFLLILNYKTYSKIHIKGIISKNELIVPVNTSNISVIKKSKKIKIDNTVSNFKIYEFSEIYNDGNTSLQDVIIKTNIQNKKENEIVDLTFYFDKDYIVKKILKGVFK
ncbi:MAG: hypothetical protein E7158_00960 [Firmicutes bacterium]|nr:hypothetical protein [Bacillota bacterium]